MVDVEGVHGRLRYRVKILGKALFNLLLDGLEFFHQASLALAVLLLVLEINELVLLCFTDVHWVTYLPEHLGEYWC